MPSLTLLGQSVVGGLLVGGLYGLVSMGLSLSWGLLRLINISQFALAFLSAYLTYHLGVLHHLEAWWSALLIVPAFFLFGVALHWVFLRFKVSELTSLLVTFGISLLIEAFIQWIWTADFRKYESGLAGSSFKIGPLYVSTLDLVELVTTAILSAATWFWLQGTLVGKALRASAHDPEIAAAYGIDHRRLSFVLSGICAAYAAVAGVFIALTSTLAPAAISSWIGVAFAVVIIGRLGNPLGVFLAGLLIGVTESVTMVALSPAWAPLVSFSILIALLLWKPQWA